MESWLISKLDHLPQKPGVYLMKDRAGEVVYVGKAINLRSRVRSYFTKSSDQRAFVALLERVLGDLETVVVSNEKEALLLENELIKKHKPRFNVRLRDDKNFICLRLDTRQTYPRIEVVRRFQKDGALYFGPYSSASSIRETMRIVNRYFQLRTCSDHVMNNRKRPCLLHQIGRCPAPCVFDIPKEDYQTHVNDVVSFLQGKTDELVESLRNKMKILSRELNFEEAARTRDKLWAIERSLEKQKIATTDGRDQDAWGVHREADRLLFYVLHVRNGRMAGGQAHFSSGQEFPNAELLASFLNLFYASGNVVPQEVLVPFEFDGMESLAEFCSDQRGELVRLNVPKRGEKFELLSLARTNAEEAFRERKQSRNETEAILQRLKERLHLSRVPYRMECIDVSHFQGAGLVASVVSALDGEPEKTRYRRYKLKTVEGNDDFASMYEIVSRRVRRGKEDKDLPDLLVIDGGKGQLAAAAAAMSDEGVEGVDLVSLAKSRLKDNDHPELLTRTPERVFLVGRKEPVVLPQNSPELLILTRLRDEAHRFAITFQQQQMRKFSLESTLEHVPGVGKSRQKALLRHFGSFQRILAANLEDLMDVAGLGPAVAERVFSFLHEEQRESEELDTVRESSLEDAFLNDGVPLVRPTGKNQKSSRTNSE